MPPVKQAYGIAMLVYRVVLVDVNRTYIRVPQKRCGEPTVEHDLSTTFLTLPTPCEGSPAPPKQHVAYRWPDCAISTEVFRE